MASARASFAVVVDPSLKEAVYAQIARQIQEAIAAGVLPAGTLLSGVRVLAADLGLNLNTVARAYRQLEGEGFVTIENRAGARVVPPGGQPSPERRDQFQDELRALLVRMRQAGLGRRELTRLVMGQIASIIEPQRT
jgi:GntR family transcriptional regulator